MTRLYKCDRCLRHTEHIRTISYITTIAHLVIPFMRVNKELCPECFAEFLSWINNDLFKFNKFVYDEKNKRVMRVDDNV